MCQFNTLTAVKTWFFYRFFIVGFFNSRFTCCVLFHFFFLVSILVSFVFFLVFFVLKYNIPYLHVSTDGTLSVCQSNFLFGVFGHCKASWMGEMCLSLSLHAWLYLCQDFTPECHVKIKCLIVSVCF